MNRPQRFDDEQADQTGHAQDHGAASAPPEHPGIGWPYRANTMPSQGEPAYPHEDSHNRQTESDDLDSRQANWSTAADPAANVFGQTSERSFSEETVDVEAGTKRRKGPILIFGAFFGVVVVAVVVSMLRIMTGEGGSDRRAQDMALTAPAIPVTTATPPAAGAGLQPMPQTTAGAAPGAPDAAAVNPGVIAPVAQVAAQPASPLPGSTAAAVESQAAEVKSLQKAIEDIKGRIDTMSREIATLREQRSRQTAESGGPKKTDKPAPVRSAAKSEKTTTAAASERRGGSSGEIAEAAVTVSAVAAAPASPGQPMQGFNLRAVFPPSGPDMQAWVMEGEVLRVVARGSTIAGHRVLDVLPDRVVTDRGVIR